MIIWLSGANIDLVEQTAQELQREVPSVILCEEKLCPKDLVTVAIVLEKQMLIIVCSSRYTEAERYRVSDLCNPLWVIVRAAGEPEVFEDIFAVDIEKTSIPTAVKRIKYYADLTAQTSYTMIFSNFHPLTDELCSQIRNKRFEVFNTLVLAVSDIKKSEDNPPLPSTISRVQALKREFGSSVKIVTYPYAKAFWVERHDTLKEIL